MDVYSEINLNTMEIFISENERFSSYLRQLDLHNAAQCQLYVYHKIVQIISRLNNFSRCASITSSYMIFGVSIHLVRYPYPAKGQK